MKPSYFVVTVMLLMMLSGCGSKADKVVINYCKALESGKFDEAESYLSKDAKLMLKHDGGISLLAKAGEEFKQRKGIKDIKITRQKVTGKSAMVEFMYNFNDGSKFADSFPLVKQNGKWKISK